MLGDFAISAIEFVQLSIPHSPVLQEAVGDDRALPPQAEIQACGRRNAELRVRPMVSMHECAAH